MSSARHVILFTPPYYWVVNVMVMVIVYGHSDTSLFLWCAIFIVSSKLTRSSADATSLF